MPQAAIRGVDIDYIVKSAEIGSLLLSLTKGEPARGAAMSQKSASGIDSAQRGGDLSKETPPGELTPITCPECGGSLWQEDDDRQVRFRCHVGHAFNGESLVELVTEEVESALWTALRVLEEHALLQERMAARSEAVQLAASAAQFHSRAADSRRQAATLRNVLMNQSSAGSTETER